MGYKTFGEYLVDQILPPDMPITKQIDDKYLKKILIELGRNYPGRYDKIFSELKTLADKLSTWEGSTMGMAEITTPNKANRDKIIRKYTSEIEKSQQKCDEDKLYKNLVGLQEDLAKNDLSGAKDDASIAVLSSMGGKKTQLMKLRTSPGVVADSKGGVIPIVFPKSYAEGVDPVQFWLGAAESRQNLAQGQVATAEPGEVGKIMANVLASAIVSREDCGTEAGILLSVRDDAVLNRYLAKKVKNIDKNTLIDADIQQKLLKLGLDTILVRSPQTCEAPGGSVCQKCMGLKNSTAKPYEIGDHAGLITEGNLGEPLNQFSLSAKHSTAMAKKQEVLTGLKGFRQIVEMPKIYPNKKVLCEVIGEVYRVRPAPQGGKTITIHVTQQVPKRYIVNGMDTPGMGSSAGQNRYIDYHVPPNLKLADNIKEGTKVYPGFPLSSGIDNLQDIARLRNLGYLRSAATQNMYTAFKNTGDNYDRRHFELLSRAAHPYLTVIKCPPNDDFVQGEEISYERLVAVVKKMPSESVSVKNALGCVLAEQVMDLTVGTEIDLPTQHYLTQNGITECKIVRNLEVSAKAVPLPRVVNKQQDWIAGLNHRNLKDQMRDAAAFRKVTDIHGYNAISAFAYGSEFGQGPQGKY